MKNMIADLIEKLLIVQNRDQKLRAIQMELVASPQERAAIEAKLAQSNADVALAKSEVQQLEMARKKLELDVQAKQDSISRFKTQQTQTRKNEEYQALTHEIERFTKDIALIEDQELEIMEGYEVAKAKLARAEEVAGTLKAAIQAQLATIDSKVDSLEKSKTETSTDRAGLVTDIDPDVLSVYDRLMKSKGNSAVVSLEHDTCTGCHMKVTTQTSHRAKAGREICHCENCGRILYWGD